MSYLFSPNDPITCAVEADVTAERLVEISGNRQVSPAAAKSAAWLGTAATSAVAGEKVAVLRGGVQRILASGAVTAGDIVVAATGGKVATLAAVTTPTAADVTDTRAIVGVAITGGTDVAIEIAMDR